MKKIILLGVMMSTFFFVWCQNASPTTTGTWTTVTITTGSLDAFAQCLTKAGVTMYGLETCSHCQQQKAMFGESFQYVTYVDCAKEPNRCTTLKWVPTREFKDKTQLEGVQSLATLAQKSDCVLK